VWCQSEYIARFGKALDGTVQDQHGTLTNRCAKPITGLRIKKGAHHQHPVKASMGATIYDHYEWKLHADVSH